MTAVQLTLSADVTRVVDPPGELPAGYLIRPAKRDDLDALGALYFIAYPRGVAGATVDEATADVRAAFDGDYGDLWLDASLIVERHGAVVGAIQIVHSAPWDDVPPGPFIIELFVHPDHRRQGLGGVLLTQSLATIRAAGATTVGLRVADDNHGALALYRQLGFAGQPT